MPELAFLLASDLAVLDHHTGEIWLVANAINFDDSDERVDEAYADAGGPDRGDDGAAGRAERRRRWSAPQIDADPAVRRQRTPDEFQAAVAAAVEEIKAGEAFQIVVSQRFEVDTTADALDIYRVLRLTNPSPYMYLLRLHERGRPASTSSARVPEALVTVKGGRGGHPPHRRLQAAGRRRPTEDAALEAELLADPKERAEHVMLVDLGRNDLGRVCRPGTVEVVEFMDVRRYSHIMHLESTVTGRSTPDAAALDVVLAAFPAGTLSGAPKVRAMEIIDDLEVSRRGLYGGVVGYFDFAGDADAAIAIRTALLKDGVALRPGRRRHRRRLRAGDRGPGVPEQGRRGRPCRRGRPDLLPGRAGGRSWVDGRCAPIRSGSQPTVSSVRPRCCLGGLLGLVAGAQPWWRASGGRAQVRFTGSEVTRRAQAGARPWSSCVGVLLALALRARGRRVVGGRCSRWSGPGHASSARCAADPSADARPQPVP